MEGQDKEVVYNARVVELLGRTGSRGTIAQVKCQLIGEGNRFLVRNVKGPVKKGDMITLLECEREARRLR